MEALEQATERVAQQAQEKRHQFKLELERAIYEASRCERQYNEVEPENRLVARSLEQRWNEALGKASQLKRKLSDQDDLPEKLTAQPEQVANDIYSAQQKGKNIIYTKWIWRWIMLIIKHIPEWKFKDMSL